jgi:hypothetical protein
MLALAVYLIVIIIRMPRFYADNVASVSDATTYMLLSNTLAHGAHGAIYLSDAPWYSTILIDVITYHLPEYRAIWIVWPVCAYVVGAGLLALTVSRLAGRWAALMTATLCLALTPAILQLFLAQAFHGLTTINCILLAIFLVYLVEIGARTTWPTFLAAMVLAIFTGVNAASDLLLVVIGIIPLTGVALILLARYRDRASLRTATLWLGTVVVAISADVATVAVGNSLSLVPRTVTTRIVRPSEVIPHLALAGGVVWKEIGPAWRYVPTEVSVRELLAGIAVLCTILAAVAFQAIRLLRSCPAKASARNRRMEAHYLIWTAMTAANFTALAFTIAPLDLGAVRYASVLWIAAAATLPLLFTRSPARQLGFAVSVIVLVGVHAGLVDSIPQTPDVNMTSVVAYLESHHIRYGYADYWESNSVTWATNGVLTLRPASSCDKSGTICAYEFGNASSWYTAKPGWSAVIVDPSHSLSIAPASRYGPPREVDHVGQVTVYIYDHDVGPLTIEPMPN